MIENILILSSEASIEYAEKKWNLKDKKNFIIPWTIEAIDLLIEKKIPYTIPSIAVEKLIPLTEDLFINRLKKFKELLNILDIIVNRNLKNKLNFEITYFTNLVYRIRHLYYKYFDEIDILYYIASLGSKNIILFTSKKNQNDSLPIKFLEKIKDQNKYDYKLDTIYLDNLALMKNKNFLQFNEFSLMKNSTFNSIFNYLKNNIKFTLNKVPYRLNIINIIFPRAFYKFKKNKNNILILLSLGDEVPLIINELMKNKNNNIIFWENLKPTYKFKEVIEIDNIIQEIDENNDLKKISTYKDIDFFDYIKKKMIYSNLNTGLIKDLIENKINFEKLHNEIGISMVITSNEFPIFEEIFNSCEKLSIPRIDFLHGGSVGFSHAGPPLIEYFRKGGDSHYKFVYTNEIINFQNKYKDIYNVNQKHVSVGSSKYRKIHNSSFLKNKLDDKLNILYVIGPINNANLFRKGLRDEIKYIEFINNVIDIFKNNKSINLYIKIGYNLQSRIPNTIKKIDSVENIHVIMNKETAVSSFNSLDIILLDSISTPLFEAASTNIPIILYSDDSSKIGLSFKKELYNRATVVEFEEDFYSLLENLPEATKDSKSNLFNENLSKEFYNKYCNPIDINENLYAISEINKILDSTYK